MKLYGIAIGINLHARSLREAEAFAEWLLTQLRNDNGESHEDIEVSVDSAELSGSVEELE